jgi:hemoglobin/transferrin/lactoferrin receptor protein
MNKNLFGLNRDLTSRILLYSLFTTTSLIGPGVIGSGLSGVAFAQNVATRSYSIPSQPLSSALIKFGQESGLQIFFDQRLTTGLTSATINGPLTNEAALSRLLAGSGLSYRFTNATTVSVIAAGGTIGADGSVMLGTIVVGDGEGLRSAAELQAETYMGAGTSAYLSQGDILNKRGSSVGDMLRGIPGVMNGNNRQANALEVNIRGLQAEGRVPVVIDGATQETGVYLGYKGNATRSYVEPDFIAGMSIEKGPSAEADATGATGGVIRARTLRPDDVIAPGGTWGLRVTTGVTGNTSESQTKATLGGWQRTETNFGDPDLLDLRGHNASAVFAYRFEKIDFLVGISRRESGNYYSGSEGRDPSEYNAESNYGYYRYGYDEQIHNTSTDSQSLLLRSVIRPNSDHTLDLSYMRYQSEDGETAGSQLQSTTEPYQTVNDVLLETTTARYRYNPGNPLIDLHIDLFKTSYESFNMTPGRYFSDMWGNENWDFYYGNASDRVGLTAYNISRFAGAMGDLSLSYGIALTHEEIGPSDEMERYQRIYYNQTAMESNVGDRVQKSAFLNMVFKPASWATFTAGGRYTYNDVQDDTANNNSWAGGAKNAENQEGFAPSFSALIEPIRGVQFYTRYAEALRGTTLNESTKGNTSTPNPLTDVKMEHARNTEIGVNLFKSGLFAEDDMFQAKLGWFNNSVKNYITEHQVTQDTTSFYTYDNIPLFETSGIEISGRYDLGPVWLDLGLTEYTKITTCLDNIGNETPGCIDGSLNRQNMGEVTSINHTPPKRTMSTTIGTRLFDEKVNLGARYTKVVGSYPFVPYELFDIFGSYRINDAATVSFAIDNIFDEYYVDALSLGWARGVNMQPAPGRTLRLSFVTTLGDGDRSATKSADERANIAALAALSEAERGNFDGDWSGYYAGIVWGGSHFATSGDTRTKTGANNSAASAEALDNTTNSVIGGLQFGYNHQTASGLVWGVEADATLGRARSDQYFADPAYVSNGEEHLRDRQAGYRQKFGPSASIRVRLGKSFGRTLIYGTGGIGAISEKMTRTQYAGSDNATKPGESESDSKLRLGVLLGAGAEYAINNHLSMKAEYLYGSYSASEFEYELGGSGANSTTGSGRRVDSELDTHNIRIGVNYRF